MNFLFRTKKADPFHQKLQDYLVKGHSKERLGELKALGHSLKFPRSTVFNHAVELIPHDMAGSHNFLRDLWEDSVGVLGRSDRKESYLYGVAMHLTMRKVEHLAFIEGDTGKAFSLLLNTAYSLLEENERLRDSL